MVRRPVPFQGWQPLRLALAAVLAAGAGLVAPSQALAETAIERAARTGELSLGVHADIPPFVSSASGGELEGYAIDVSGLIAEEVSRYLGRPVKVVAETSRDSASLFRQVHSGEVDLMCGAQFTWEREMFVDFSIPFALSGIRLLRRDGGIDGSPDSLRGRRIGVVAGSLGEATVKAVQPAAVLVPQPSLAEGVSALRAGRLDAVAGDTLLLAAAARGAGLSQASLVPEVPYTRFAVGCAMPENNSTLRNLVNLALARMMQGYIDGSERQRQMVNRWLGPQSGLGLPEEMISLYFRSVLLNHESLRVSGTP
jgi:polar amino acid transport system substrate-binding protein